jgi:hypothetical protein
MVDRAGHFELETLAFHFNPSRGRICGSGHRTGFTDTRDAPNTVTLLILPSGIADSVKDILQTWVIAAPSATRRYNQRQHGEHRSGYKSHSMHNNPLRPTRTGNLSETPTGCSPNEIGAVVAGRPVVVGDSGDQLGQVKRSNARLVLDSDAHANPE